MSFHVAVTPEKGPAERGIIADSPFKPDDTIFWEKRPLVAAPFQWTRDYFPMCDHCLRSMERPDAMLARLAGLPKEQIQLKCLDAYRAKVIAHNNADPAAAAGGEPSDASIGFTFEPLDPKPVPCPHCPLEAYCSPSCRQLAWNQHHRYLCPRDPHPSSNSPYVALANMWKEFHPPPEATTPFLVARIICHIRGQIEQGVSLEVAAAPYMDFKRAPTTPEGESSLHRLFMNSPTGQHTNGSSSSSSSAATPPTSLQEVHAALVRLLGDPAVPPELLTYSAFLDIFGLIALNGQGIGTSALDNYQLFLRSLGGSPDAASDLETIEALDSLIEEHSAPYLRAEGSGLFPTHRFLNHSCSPNAEIRFESDGKGYELKVVATKDIAPGQEITIAYLDDEDCDDDDCGHDHGNGNGDGDGDWEDMDGDAAEVVEDDEEMDEEEDGERQGDERRRQLKQFYLFDCRCERCVEELKDRE